MHNRLKVKTTAEQDAEKQKERAKKLQLYTAGLNKALHKRKNAELDQESLGITGQLLTANPDLYTMWNFRKEILEKFLEQKESSEFQEILNGEIKFTENCLQVNYKSYGTWHHRIWILNKMLKPDWDREIQLCTKFLEMDERNFHCWGYRFYVAEKAEASPKTELEFTDKKISSNFSNYSAWHYRSKLLPRIYPDPARSGQIQEEKYLQELELVQNAVFTDPNDQSAWFYRHWLLGNHRKDLLLNSMHVSRDGAVIVVFNKFVKADFVESEVKLKVNETFPIVKWRKQKSRNGAFKVWVAELSDLTEDDLECVASVGTSILKCCLLKGQQEAWVDNRETSTALSAVPETKLTVLRQELDQWTELQEMEPDCKLVLLNIILLKRILNAKEKDEEIMEMIQQSMKVDPMRVGYYSDLRSKLIIENAIESSSEVNDEFVLRGKELSALYHLDRLVRFKNFDFSHNNVQNLSQIGELIRAERIIFDNNKVKSCYGLESLERLDHLSLRNNNITEFDTLECLSGLSSLRSLDLRGNPVCSLENYALKVRTIAKKLQFLDGSAL